MKRSSSVFGRPLFPFLAALYPFLVLAEANRDQVLGLCDLVLPIVVSLAIAGICWILAGFVDRTRPVRGLLALLGVVFLLWYGLLNVLLDSLPGNVRGQAPAMVLAGWTVLFGVAVVFVLRKRPESQALVDYLNLFAAILLLFPLYGLVRPRGDAWQAVTTYPEASSESGRSDSRPEPPDIYLIVLDKYTSGRSLAAVYDYDNGLFEEQLRQRGFVVPEASRTNYVHTHLSLASMLNYTHLQEVAAASGIDSSDRWRTVRMIEDNRAWRFLKRRGYRFYFFGSAYSATIQNRLADVEVRATEARPLNLAAAWLSDTSFIAAVGYVCHFVDCRIGERRFPYQPETLDQLRQKFERLSRVASRPGFKFVFAHVLAPHEPFLFGPDCSEREMTWPANADPDVFPRFRKLYTQQVDCLNRMVLDLVDSLLQGSSRPPVILLQADHGHGRMDLDPAINRVTPFEELDPAQIRERVEVFAAYYLPGDPPPDVPPTMSPVNLFPVVFDYYFDAGIPMREDVTYWSEPWRPFNLRLVRSSDLENRP